MQKVEFNVVSDPHHDFQPTKANREDVGYDIKLFGFSNNADLKHFSTDESPRYLQPHKSIVVSTGFSLKMPEEISFLQGDEFQYSEHHWHILSAKVHSRSGLGFKASLIAFSGIIDNGYQKQMLVKLFNLSDNVITLKRGDKIAQLEFFYLPLVDTSVNYVDTVEELNRGTRGGFGSSGR